MAKEFGSRAEMISLKIDEVSRNKIWREHCTKVQKQHKLNTTFCIGDPRKSAKPIPPRAPADSQKNMQCHVGSPHYSPEVTVRHHADGVGIPLFAQ
jgi:hypothetical protein